MTTTEINESTTENEAELETAVHMATENADSDESSTSPFAALADGFAETLNPSVLTRFIEALLFAAKAPMTEKQLQSALPGEVPVNQIRLALQAIEDTYNDRAVALVFTGMGYRFRVRPEYAKVTQTLLEEKPQRLSRAFMETLALIAYRQPITRAEIEAVRGVAVSSNIIKGLIELEWVRIVGHKDLPGKPALLATTKGFLDHFGLESIDALPPLAELVNLEALTANPEGFADDSVDDESDADSVCLESEGEDPLASVDEATAEQLVLEAMAELDEEKAAKATEASDTPDTQTTQSN